VSAAEELRPYTVVCDTDDEPAWLSSRFAGIGASEIGAVIGMDHRSSPLKLFLEKTGALPPEDLSEVEMVEWGHILEPVIAEQYRKRTGRIVRRGRSRKYCVLRSNEHPWALASLDFWTGENENDLWPLEIKNAHQFRADDWLNGTPDYHIAQLHQQMVVTGARKGTSACLLGGNRLLWCDVARDEVLIRKIQVQGAKFWERVERRDPPPPDGTTATTDALKRLYPNSNGETVVLPAVLEDRIYEWRRLKDEQSARKKQIDAIENEIKATMGEAERGIVLSTKDEVSWKANSVREHVVKAHTQRTLRFHEKRI
jgi:putative phage-type endonuclease